MGPDWAMNCRLRASLLVVTFMSVPPWLLRMRRVRAHDGPLLLPLPVAQRGEGVGAGGGVQVAPRRDRVLRAVRRRAGAGRQRVAGVVVISGRRHLRWCFHFLHHLMSLIMAKMSVTAGASLAKMRARGVLSYENQSPYLSTSAGLPLVLNTSAAAGSVSRL